MTKSGREVFPLENCLTGCDLSPNSNCKNKEVKNALEQKIQKLEKQLSSFIKVVLVVSKETRKTRFPERSQVRCPSWVTSNIGRSAHEYREFLGKNELHDCGRWNDVEGDQRWQL